MVKALPSNTGAAGSIPGWEANIPHALWSQNEKKKQTNQRQYCNKFNKDFKNGPHEKNSLKINFICVFKENKNNLYNDILTEHKHKYTHTTPRSGNCLG